jgi:hypothetical protein
MANPSGVDFFFRPTRASDVPEIEAIASRYALRVPAGLTSAVDDPNQRLITALSSSGVVIGFLRFKIAPEASGEGAQWTDLIVDPNFLKHEFKLAILNQAKNAGTTVSTMPGLITGSLKTFVKEQARALGYHVEDVKPSQARSLILHF